MDFWDSRKDGLLGFTAEVLLENKPMLRVFEKMGFDMHKVIESGAYSLVMNFGESNEKRG